jgi:hypothetical protein
VSAMTVQTKRVRNRSAVCGYGLKPSFEFFFGANA